MEEKKEVPKAPRRKTTKAPKENKVDPIARLALNYLTTIPTQLVHEFSVYFATAMKEDTQFDTDVKAVMLPIVSKLRVGENLTGSEVISLACCLAIAQAGMK